jgi:beta-galactosidase
MNLRPILNIVFFIILVIPAGEVLTQERKKIQIDENWKFQFGHAADAAKDFNYSITTLLSKTGKSEQTAIHPGFNDSGWRTVQLPHDWAVELPFVHSPNLDVMAHGYKPVGGLFPETSIGWYRKMFSVAEFTEMRLSGVTGITWEITPVVISEYPMTSLISFGMKIRTCLLCV